MKQPRVKVNAHAYGVGFYLFGCMVFGDTTETDKSEPRFFVVHTSDKGSRYFRHIPKNTKTLIE